MMGDQQSQPPAGLLAPRIIAAVVVTFNRYPVLVETLASVHAQTRPADFVLIVDNASPDGTADRLVAEGRGHEVLQMPSNEGPGAAMAAGMRRAIALGADIIWLVEDDTLYDRDYVHVGLSLLDADPTISILGSRAWFLRPRTALWQGMGLPNDERAHQVDLVTLDGALVRAETVVAAGCPVENYFIMMQDIEYPLRLRRAGLVLCASTALKATPLGLGAAGGSVDPEFRSYYIVRNHLRMVLSMRSPQLAFGFLCRLGALVFSDLRSDAKLRRLAMRFAGVIDGLIGRMGRTVEPGARWPWGPSARGSR